MNIKLLFIVWSRYNKIALSAFFKHYKALGIKDFFCIYHELDDANLEQRKFIEDNALIIHSFTGEHTPELEIEMKNKYKRQIAESEDDWILLVDADEFLLISKDELEDVINSSANYFNAHMVDYFSKNGLIEITNEPVFEQFTIPTFFSRDVLNACTDKVPLTRAYVPLAVGHHSVSNFIDDFQYDGVLVPYNEDSSTWARLAHIKWHSQLLEDMYVKMCLTVNCPYWRREIFKFVLDHLYKKKSISELIEPTVIRD